jgi:hypothetical protein
MRSLCLLLLTFVSSRILARVGMTGSSVRHSAAAAGARMRT